MIKCGQNPINILNVLFRKLFVLKFTLETLIQRSGNYSEHPGNRMSTLSQPRKSF